MPGSTTSFKTATGEIASGNGLVRVECKDEYGLNCNFKGAIGPVHKPLLSVGDVDNNGHDAYFFDGAGYMILKTSKLHRELRKVFEG